MSEKKTKPSIKPVRSYNGNAHRRMISRLKEHIDIHGPLSHTKHGSVDAKLVSWSQYVRSHILEMTPKLMEALIDAGFFDYSEEAWLGHFYEIKERYRISAEGEPLQLKKGAPERVRRWIGKQRSRRNSLDICKLALLQSIHFDWEPRKTAQRRLWETRFRELVDYRERFGDCDVPSGWPENKALAKWVSQQRSARSRMADDRRERLEQLGMTWDLLEKQWERRFEQLVAFKQKYGHCRVTLSKSECLALVSWVRVNRAKSDQLTEERRKRLDEIGFDWDPFQTLWEGKFKALERYMTQNKGGNILRQWPTKGVLGKWVIHQRVLQREGALRSEYEARLNELGFVWHARDSIWDQRFKELEAFKKRYGHTSVPARWVENPTLSLWVGTQRSRKCTLSKSRLARLDSIGFVWDVFRNTWDERYTELESFKAQYGHCRVPAHNKEHPQLSAWVNSVRMGGVKMTPAQKRKLSRLGFVWEVHGEAWERNFKAMQEYIREHGHSMVPDRPGCSLSNWVGLQRIERSKGKLDADRVKRLDALGFVWDVFAHRWETNFAQLVLYQKKHGNCRISSKKHPELAAWVTKERARFKKGKMPKENEERLNAIGFVWDPHRMIWEQRVEELKDYEKRFGNCDVPSKWPENPQLGAWVWKQRNDWKSLSSVRRKQLEAVGLSSVLL